MTSPRPDIAAMLHDWRGLSRAFRAIAVAEHPPITDGYGRVWNWKDRDLYTHDDTLALPRDLIDTAGLPRPGLATENPNYAGLCSICRREDPTP